MKIITYTRDTGNFLVLLSLLLLLLLLPKPGDVTPHLEIRNAGSSKAAKATHSIESKLPKSNP